MQHTHQPPLHSPFAQPTWMSVRRRVVSDDIPGAEFLAVGMRLMNARAHCTMLLRWGLAASGCFRVALPWRRYHMTTTPTAAARDSRHDGMSTATSNTCRDIAEWLKGGAAARRGGGGTAEKPPCTARKVGLVGGFGTCSVWPCRATADHTTDRLSH